MENEVILYFCLSDPFVPSPLHDGSIHTRERGGGERERGGRGRERAKAFQHYRGRNGWEDWREE